MRALSALTVLAILLAGAPAHADEAAPDLRYADVALLPSQTPITGFVLDPTRIEVRATQIGAYLRPVGVVLGQYSSPQESLVCDDSGVLRKINPDKNFFFTLEIPLSGGTTKLRCWSVDIQGATRIQEIGILYPAYELFIKQANAAPTKPYSFIPSLGYSLIDYKETRGPNFTLHALTMKVSGRYAIRPWLDIRGNAFITALPLSNGGLDATVRFLGINAGVGLGIPWLKEPWKLSVGIGGYYNHMMVTDDAFGYQPALYPSVTPTIRRALGNSDSVFGYVKYVPLGESVSFASSDREFALGIGWAHLLSGARTLNVSFDFASLQFSSALTDTFTSTYQATSYSLSVGYGL